MAISIVPPTNQPSTHNSTSSHPSRTSTAYAPVSQLAARDDLNGIAAVLCGHWEHLLPHQAAQLIERAVEKCKPFVPAELHSTLDTICDMAAYIRVQRSGRVAGLSGPCSSCGYYECSYCGNCHNPSCTAYTPTCSRSVEVRA